ncbi:MAG: hypothetical protein R2716_07985 [Microthrixaceae bacterium]
MDNDPHTLPLVLEAPVVQVDLGGEEVSLQVWRAMPGRRPSTCSTPTCPPTRHTCGS